MLVPREMKVEHSGGVKAMSDGQLEAAFELLQGMVDQRLGEKAKLVEGVARPQALPAPDVVSSEKMSGCMPLPIRRSFDIA
jgi:hypothetical protein